MDAFAAVDAGECKAGVFVGEDVESAVVENDEVVLAATTASGEDGGGAVGVEALLFVLVEDFGVVDGT